MSQLNGAESPAAATSCNSTGNFGATVATLKLYVSEEVVGSLGLGPRPPACHGALADTSLLIERTV
jgi:hypothetical protein